MWQRLLKSMAKNLILTILGEAVTRAKEEVDSIKRLTPEERVNMKHGIDLLAVRVEDKL